MIMTIKVEPNKSTLPATSIYQKNMEKMKKQQHLAQMKFIAKLSMIMVMFLTLTTNQMQIIVKLNLLKMSMTHMVILQSQKI